MGFGALDFETLLIVGVNPTVYILADIIDAHSAVLLGWSQDPGFDVSFPFDGVVVLTEDGEGFGIGVSSGAFSIGRCDFDRYLGLFLGLTNPTTDRSAATLSALVQPLDRERLLAAKQEFLDMAAP